MPAPAGVAVGEGVGVGVSERVAVGVGVGMPVGEGVPLESQRLTRCDRDPRDGRHNLDRRRPVGDAERRRLSLAGLEKRWQFRSRLGSHHAGV